MAEDSLFEISRAIVFYRDFNFGCYIRFYLVYSPIIPMIDGDGLAPQKQSCKVCEVLNSPKELQFAITNDQEYLTNDQTNDVRPMITDIPMVRVYGSSSNFSAWVMKVVRTLQ